MQHKRQYKRKLCSDIGGIIKGLFPWGSCAQRDEKKRAETEDIITPLLKPLMHPYLR